MELRLGGMFLMTSDNKWEKACREFLKGCANTIPTNSPPEECRECVIGFCIHLRKLLKGDPNENQNHTL